MKRHLPCLLLFGLASNAYAANPQINDKSLSIINVIDEGAMQPAIVISGNAYKLSCSNLTGLGGLIQSFGMDTSLLPYAETLSIDDEKLRTLRITDNPTLDCQSDANLHYNIDDDTGKKSYFISYSKLNDDNRFILHSIGCKEILEGMGFSIDNASEIELGPYFDNADRYNFNCVKGSPIGEERKHTLSDVLKLSDDGKTVLVTGANLQIVNGLGATEEVNGLGNLIVGYNESNSEGVSYCSRGGIFDEETCLRDGYLWDSDQRVGSHNIVGGRGNSYTEYGGLILGTDGMINAPFATISGGNANQSSGIHATINGGLDNRAWGDESSIIGGTRNQARGHLSTVVGGEYNRSNGAVSSAFGGIGNSAEGVYSGVVAGEGNKVEGYVSSAIGGRNNISEGDYSNISGGANTTNNRSFSSIFGYQLKAK